VIERDYIMRMVDMLGKFLARALFLKTSHDFPKAADELATAYKNLLGLDRTVALTLSESQLVTLMGGDGPITASKCFVLGMLLKEDADLFRVQGDNDHPPILSGRALSLLLTAYCAEGKPLHGSHRQSIEDLWTSCDQGLLTTSTRGNMFRFYELTGRFDRAEDLLFTLIELDKTFLAAGLEFYQRISERTDKELESGNLPRAEVEESMRELRAMPGNSPVS
jgi:hypothetical protein